MSELEGLAERLEELLPLVLRCLHTACHDPLSELPMTQLKVVRHLDCGPLTPSALAAEMNTTLGAVTQIVGRLEDSGLVEKRTDGGDRRVRYLDLTPKARGLMSERRRVRTARAQEVLDRLDVESAREVIHGLETLLRVSREGDRVPSETLEVTEELERGVSVRSEA